MKLEEEEHILDLLVALCFDPTSWIGGDDDGTRMSKALECLRSMSDLLVRRMQLAPSPYVVLQTSTKSQHNTSTGTNVCNSVGWRMALVLVELIMYTENLRHRTTGLPAESMMQIISYLDDVLIKDCVSI